MQNFRCFTDETFSFSSKVTLITGDNGTGKTSIIEAIHYLCYFKSFRSHILSDLSLHNSDTFFLKGYFTLRQDDSQEPHSIQVGYGHKKRVIKLDMKNVASHKETFPYFKVLTLMEDDIDLIRGNPSGRRAFIDQAVIFACQERIDLYKKFKIILSSRNALLQKGYGLIDSVELEIWTEKLWEVSLDIAKYRKEALSVIQVEVNRLLNDYFDGMYQVDIKYESKLIVLDESLEFFLQKLSQLSHQELAMKRSMFGSHLDDLVFCIKGTKARSFASRGQQKLVSLLCKLALISTGNQNEPLPLLLIDDFISDFDKIRLEKLINFLLSCKNQIIMTTPFCNKELEMLLAEAHPDVISITP